MSKTRKRVFGGIFAVTGVWLAGCAAPVAAPPPKRDDFYIEKETYRPHKPKPPPEIPPSKPLPATPASAPAAEPAPAAAQPAAPAQLPAAAQSPTAVPPAGGLPHDASQYIEPPPR
jgi:hypothetical protein